MQRRGQLAGDQSHREQQDQLEQFARTADRKRAHRWHEEIVIKEESGEASHDRRPDAVPRPEPEHQQEI